MIICETVMYFSYRKGDKLKMKAFMKEFKEFISRGNVMDMAVGVIIGGAFTGIIDSQVNDLFMPPLCPNCTSELQK